MSVVTAFPAPGGVRACVTQCALTAGVLHLHISSPSWQDWTKKIATVVPTRLSGCWSILSAIQPMHKSSPVEAVALSSSGHTASPSLMQGVLDASQLDAWRHAVSQWPVSSLHCPAAFNRAPSWEPRRLSSNALSPEPHSGQLHQAGAELGGDAGQRELAKAHGTSPERTPVPPQTPPSHGSSGAASAQHLDSRPLLPNTLKSLLLSTLCNPRG